VTAQRQEFVGIDQFEAAVSTAGDQCLSAARHVEHALCQIVCPQMSNLSPHFRIENEQIAQRPDNGQCVFANESQVADRSHSGGDFLQRRSIGD